MDQKVKMHVTWKNMEKVVVLPLVLPDFGWVQLF